MWRALCSALSVHIVLTSFIIGSGEATRCFVCGMNASVADRCVDNYYAELRAEDLEECVSDVPGCIKTKYVDDDEKQIVTRSCAPEVGMRHEVNDCKQTEVAKHKVYFCHCLEDGCNGSPSAAVSLLLSLTCLSLTWL